MSRLFIGDREVAFFNGINKELLQKIICQKIIYYSVSYEHTKTHRLYDEAVRKTVFESLVESSFDNHVERILCGTFQSSPNIAKPLDIVGRASQNSQK